MAGPGDNTRSVRTTTRATRLAGLALAALALTGCPQYFHQSGANSRFLTAASKTYETNKLLLGYRNAPALFVERLVGAGASCATKNDTPAADPETICGYVYCLSNARIMVWQIKRDQISTFTEWYSDADGNPRFGCDGENFRQYQLEYVQRNGATLIDKV